MALVTAGALSGCGTGFEAQTTTVYTAPVGAGVRTGDVKGLNMLVVAGTDGAGTLVAALVNTTDEDDQLEEVTVSDLGSDQPLTVTGLDTPVELPAGTLVQVADGDVPPIGVSGEAVEAGQVLSVNLRFSMAGAVVAEVPVVAAEGEYADVPTPEPISGTGDDETG
jgi:hypothetical protein